MTQQLQFHTVDVQSLCLCVEQSQHNAELVLLSSPGKFPDRRLWFVLYFWNKASSSALVLVFGSSSNEAWTCGGRCCSPLGNKTSAVHFSVFWISLKKQIRFDKKEAEKSVQSKRCGADVTIATSESALHHIDPHTTECWLPFCQFDKYCENWS